MGHPLLLLFYTAALYWCLYYILRFNLLKNVSIWRGSITVKLSPADIADISNKVLSALHASVTSVVGLYIMWDTVEDCLYSRSEAVAYTYVGVSYMTCDLLAMYITYCTSKSLSVTSRRNIFIFIRNKPLLVLHHLVLVLCSPILVYDSLRKRMGDFLIGTLFLRELSSLPVCTAKIMKRINMEDSVMYRANGPVLICVFFLVRVANTPLTLLFYSAQHHQWDLYKALSAMRPICHILLTAELSLQLYWFSMIVRTVFRAAKRKHS